MGREMWGAYSVRDHLEPQPWAADVLLYDRLVISVPPQPDGLQGSEWQRWIDEGWQPQRQAQLISILGDAAYPVPWDGIRRQEWSDLHGAALGKLSAQINVEGRRPSVANPWATTAMILAGGLPRGVTAVTAVATYRSAEQLATAVELHEADPVAPMPAGQVVIIMGREFLLPEPAQFASDDDLLRAAVELAADEDVRRRRRAYWRWQREFLTDGMFIDADSIDAAVSEMQDLIADEHRAVRRRHLRLISMFAMCGRRGSHPRGRTSGTGNPGRRVLVRRTIRRGRGFGPLRDGRSRRTADRRPNGPWLEAIEVTVRCGFARVRHLAQRRVSDQLDRSLSKVIRIEIGVLALNVTYVQALPRLYDIDTREP